MRLIRNGVAAGGDSSLLISAMRRVDLFAPLSDEQSRKLVYFIKVVEFDAGEKIFSKGDAADSFYMIQDGRVQARGAGFLGMGRIIREMGPGEFFGELALILNQPRSASIVCVERTSCFVLSRVDMELLMERNPDIADIIKKVAKQRYEHQP